MPVSTHQLTSLAAEQLDAAIELFLTGRSDVSALTLAGAAEEILGQAVKFSGGENALMQAYEVTAQTHGILHGNRLKWQDFVDGENIARNAVKHMKKRGQSTVETDLRRAAQWMIARACANYERAEFARTDRMREFDDWFFEHEVGL